MMVAEAGADVHYSAPRCLQRRFDASADRWGIDVRGLSREELTTLIKSSTREIPTTEHRRLHQEEGDFVRWGRRGGQKNPGPLRTSVLLAARPLEVGAR
jgi:hypothetical protein